MRQITVGIGQCAVSSDPESILATFGLGSCIALAAWDPVRRTAGLLHYMFPESTQDQGRSRSNPFLFGDTGIAAMLRLLQEQGSIERGLILRAAGGAKVLHGPSLFDIGRRNHESMRRVLSGAGLLIQDEDVGGKHSRTLRLDAGTGRCWVDSHGRVVELGVRRGTTTGG